MSTTIGRTLPALITLLRGQIEQCQKELLELEERYDEIWYTCVKPYLESHSNVKFLTLGTYHNQVIKTPKILEDVLYFPDDSWSLFLKDYGYFVKWKSETNERSEETNERSEKENMIYKNPF